MLRPPAPLANTARVACMALEALGLAMLALGGGQGAELVVRHRLGGPGGA